MRIVGIGVDRIRIDRVAGTWDRFGERFVSRVYTPREVSQAMVRGNPARRLAMLFAAKEAVAKALGTGFRQQVAPRDIETLHAPSGKPEVRLHHGAAKVAKDLHIRQIHVSLSDDDGIAMAFAIAEGSM
ncbi:MAG: holo-[acyl-carrier-protein] synthase [Zetaproteobacteria bacterium]|nr:MAG: holo-[acyl-carrier-protein] synthase [Zetaproteobacteria bacterium]